MLVQEQAELAVRSGLDADPATRERAVDRCVHGRALADLADGLQRCGKVRPVGAQDRCSGADLAAVWLWRSHSRAVGPTPGPTQVPPPLDPRTQRNGALDPPRRQAEVHGLAKIVSGKPEPQADH